MTLEEAIKHAEGVAKENQRVVDTGIVFDDVTIDMLYCDDTEVIEEHLANYQRCADRHRQLAEWLKDYKRLLEQQPCDDAIGRQAVHETIERWAGSMNVLVALPTREIRPLLDSIHDLPSVNPQPKTGHWKYAEQLQAEICSCCSCIKGNYFFSDIEVPIKFCPNCGASMESEERE